jgi:hypothetical protein
MTSTLLRSANAGFFRNINRNLIAINKLKDKCKLKSTCDCNEFKCRMLTLLDLEDQIERVDHKKSFDYREVEYKLPCGVLKYDDDLNIGYSKKYELIVNI